MRWSQKEKPTFKWGNDTIRPLLKRNRELVEQLPPEVQAMFRNMVTGTNLPRDAYRTEYPGGLK